MGYRTPRVSGLLESLPTKDGDVMNLLAEVNKVLDSVLSLGGRGMQFNAETPLLGAVPELDSMAVVTLITTLEDRFGLIVEDDEISGDLFANVGSLVAFVDSKLCG